MHISVQCLSVADRGGMRRAVISTRHIGGVLMSPETNQVAILTSRKREAPRFGNAGWQHKLEIAL
jgi:hypothetical protein